MGRSAIVAGTGFEGRDNLIRSYCKDGLGVALQREPNNQHDEYAIAVYLKIPRLFGLLGTSNKKIGYIKASLAKSLAKKMDSGQIVTGKVSSFDVHESLIHPRVSLNLEY